VDKASLSNASRIGACGHCGADPLGVAKKQKPMSTIFRPIGAVVFLVAAGHGNVRRLGIDERPFSGKERGQIYFLGASYCSLGVAGRPGGRLSIRVPVSCSISRMKASEPVS
jgi:hypothetical protein